MAADSKTQLEYLSGFRVRASKNKHLLYEDDADSTKQRGSHIPPYRTGGDEVEVVSSRQGPSSSFCVVCTYGNVSVFDL